MKDLQKEFETTGYASWINADLYPDGNIYTKEYTQWLERQLLALRQPTVSGSLQYRLFELANDFAVNKQGEVAVKLHSIHNGLQ